jgi:hypothetical protein
LFQNAVQGSDFQIGPMPAYDRASAGKRGLRMVLARRNLEI